ncbi:MAG: hypothetical protein FJX76_11730 [Armatimonadetes bacterium]|nr:hypothetical protein [Armatimonadota bacterium]
MDTSNTMGWNSGISSLGGNVPRREAIGRQPGEAAETTAAPGDQVSITAPAGNEAPLEIAAAPVAEAPAAALTATPREAIPSLLVDEGPGALVGSNPFAQKDSVAGLGVLSMMDESVVAHEAGHATPVRAIDGTGEVSAFADLNLAGPGNAAKYLSNPEALYLGV